MHLREFEDEARRLAKPCVYLQSHGDVFAAVWGGPAVVLPPPGGSYRHWLSVAARHVPGCEASTGVFSIFTDDSGEGGAVSYGGDLQLPAGGAALRLYAQPAVSLPPAGAVFMFGSKALQAWLLGCGWSPEAGYNANFPDAEPVEEYEKLYQAASPFYSGGAHAVLGGWHFPWPDGDWAELTSAQLLVWTFADSEPWVEAWSQGERRWVHQRIT